MTSSTTPTRVAGARLPTLYGSFRMEVFLSASGQEHVALSVGDLQSEESVYCRLHSECMTGDVFGSYRCDCGEQLQDSMYFLQQHGTGVLLYLRQEGRGIGLTNKIRAYAIQEQGSDTLEANLALGFPGDAREYSEAAAILLALGVSRVRLLTNNPAKIDGLESHGVTVTARVPLQVRPNEYNLQYLRTKRERMGHLLGEMGIPQEAETLDHIDA